MNKEIRYQDEQYLVLQTNKTLLLFDKKQVEVRPKLFSSWDEVQQYLHEQKNA